MESISILNKKPIPIVIKNPNIVENIISNPY